jgi:hypothetical protein
MKNHYFQLFFYSSCTCWSAQQTQQDTTKLWTKGNLSLLLTNLLDNGLGGGTSNIAGNFGVNYDFNYKRGCCLG